jgi:hypothetical protein
MTGADATAGVELTCRECSYQVASATAREFGPAARSFPDECRLCGGALVEVSG